MDNKTLKRNTCCFVPMSELTYSQGKLPSLNAADKVKLQNNDTDTLNLRSAPAFASGNAGNLGGLWNKIIAV